MKLLITSAILFLVVSPLVQAKHKNDYHNANKHSRYTVKAKVIESSPVYKYITVEQPHAVCKPIAVPSIAHRTSDNGAAIAGGIVGGLIGHNASSDKHKGLGTLMGAMIGSSIGHNIVNHNKNTYKKTSKSCSATYKTIEKVRVLDGYNVTYRLNGKIYRSFTPEKPGKYIRIDY